MRRRGMAVVSGAVLCLAAVAGVAPTAGGVQARDLQAGAREQASLVARYAPGNGHYQDDVSALSTSDAWEVGRRYTAALVSYAWARHWDGTTWTQVRPAPAYDGEFNGVATVTSHDVWAVGDYLAPGGSGFGDVMTEHWDGTAWTRIDAAPAPGFNTFESVAAVSSSDVWAVGTADGQPWAERWDGSAWHHVATPHVDADFAGFYGVSASARDDVYAVGVAIVGGVNRPLIAHWDGTSWSLQHVRARGASWFFSVSESGPGDVWAVGATLDADGRRQPFAAHQDGTGWRTVATARSSALSTETADVVARSPVDAWIVGYRRTSRSHTLTEHWDGSTWTRVASPDRGHVGSDLYGVAAAGRDDLLAVGTFGAKGNKVRGLNERWDGTAWSVVR